MRVWSLVSQKGGSGKTTLAIHLAIAAQLKGEVVSIIDLDPQRSAEQWADMREARTGSDEPTVVHGTAPSLDAMLRSARDSGTDLVVIDTPPAVDRSMIFAAAASISRLISIAKTLNTTAKSVRNAQIIRFILFSSKVFLMLSSNLKMSPIRFS